MRPEVGADNALVWHVMTAKENPLTLCGQRLDPTQPTSAPDETTEHYCSSCIASLNVR